MYVSELDRPWLETPFLFQGFYIRNQEEIDAVRSHCQSIVIDTRIEDETPATQALPVPRRPAEAMRELRVEIKQASGIHVAVYASVEDVMGELKDCGKLNVATLEKAVEPMVDSVLRNPAAMSCLMHIADYRVVDLNQVSPTADDPSSLWIESGLEPGAYGVDPSEYYLN